MDEDLFDEFGNLVGQDPFDSDAEDEISLDEHQETNLALRDGNVDGSENEDTTEFPTKLTRSTLQETYGNDVEILVETENTQSLSEPIVKPEVSRSDGREHTIFTKLRKNIPKTNFDREYLNGMLQIPERIRNVCVIGPLHSGKTSLTDLLVVESHKCLPHMTKNIELGWKQLRYTDNLKQEQERGVSIKLNGITFLSTCLLYTSRCV